MDTCTNCATLGFEPNQVAYKGSTLCEECSQEDYAESLDCVEDEFNSNQD